MHSLPSASSKCATKKKYLRKGTFYHEVNCSLMSPHFYPGGPSPIGTFYRGSPERGLISGRTGNRCSFPRYPVYKRGERLPPCVYLQWNNGGENGPGTGARRPIQGVSRVSTRPDKRPSESGKSRDGIPDHIQTSRKARTTH